MKPSKIPRILTIAGSDSSGGAGIQADLKTFDALGCYGASVITAITAQNTQGVLDSQNIEPHIIEKQFEAVMTDIGADSIKTGMLSSPEVVKMVSACIKRWPVAHFVLDPVLRSTSGANLGGTDTAIAMVNDLFPIASLITPNLIEASVLLGRAVTDISQMKQAALDLLELGPKAVLLKGGHLLGDELLDFLVLKESGQIFSYEFRHQKIKTKNTHGTGCTLASAIACGLARDQTMSESVESSIQFVQEGLIHGRDLNLGQGHGPLWHMHPFYPQK